MCDMEFSEDEKWFWSKMDGFEILSEGQYIYIGMDLDSPRFIVGMRFHEAGNNGMYITIVLDIEEWRNLVELLFQAERDVCEILTKYTQRTIERAKQGRTIERGKLALSYGFPLSQLVSEVVYNLKVHGVVFDLRGNIRSDFVNALQQAVQELRRRQL